LKRADVTVGNLESNLSKSGAPQPGKDVTFRGDPRAIQGLKASGFDFVALGNNHVLDYGPASLKDTLALLDRAGIEHAGAGMNRAAAWKPAVVTRDGATVAFLSFSHILPAGFVATDSKAGLARGRGNMDAVSSAIKAAQARYDYVLVSFHWGIEYKDYANADQVRDARRAIDAGADMVLSHHPHVLQGVELYKGKLIAYSLGNFAGWKNFGRSGDLALSGLLTVKVAGDGRVLGGKWLSLRIADPGVPKLDPSRAAVSLAKRRSAEDFATPVKLRADGTFRIAAQ